MHGGVKFYRGAAAAARCYVEADRSRADDYYLAEGTGLATRYVAAAGDGDVPPTVTDAGTLDGPAYERWVAGYDVETGAAKGQLRTDERGLRFVEVVVNGPKTWSLAASLHPEIAEAYDAAQERAAREIIGWLAAHATTRVGPRGRQVQVPVDRLEAAVVRHYTSRAGDPHRHLHLQVNARVLAGGQWRGLHSVGVVDSIQAINGIGHAAVACDPGFRRALAARGYHLDPASGEVAELAPYAGRFSARAAQIARNIDRYEAAWRAEHPGAEPDHQLRRTWDRRAWAQARPDKVTPTTGADLAARWRQELHDLGFTPPPPDPDRGAGLVGTAVARVNRDAVADLVLTRLGARRSAWNAADIRGEAEHIVAGLDVITPPAVRGELVEDLTARAVARCVPLLDRARRPRARPGVDVPAGPRRRGRPHRRGSPPAPTTPAPRNRSGARTPGGTWTRPSSARSRRSPAPHDWSSSRAPPEPGRPPHSPPPRPPRRQGHRLVVVTPTLKAAQVVQAETGADAFSAAWLAHRHGHRWDTDGHRWHQQTPLDPMARLLPGDLLVVDEAGMLDQDTAQALLHIADTAGARLALVGDCHQLPAVGRGGVLDHATRWTTPTRTSCSTASTGSPTPTTPPSPSSCAPDPTPPRCSTPSTSGGRSSSTPATSNAPRPRPSRGLVIADTRDQVAALNAAIRDHRRTQEAPPSGPAVTTRAGESVSAGDLVATRRNNPDLGVANRDRWTVTTVADRRLAHRPRPARHPAPARRLRPGPCRARLRHHRPRRPGRHRPRRALPPRRRHRRRRRLRRHDPRPALQHRPPRRRHPRRTPAPNGSRRSAATAPTSGPPTPPTRPPRTSTATGPNPGPLTSHLTAVPDASSSPGLPPLAGRSSPDRSPGVGR